MVVTTAAVIHGILGVTPTWERLEVTPHLPPDWPWAEADILYKGRRHHIRVDGAKVDVRPLGQGDSSGRSGWRQDSNADGIGGLPGMIRRLDYFQAR
jgi:cellobiose phosphorylase